MTYKEALAYTFQMLKPLGLTMPGLEARELVAYASDLCGTQVKKDDIVRLGPLTAPPDIVECLERLLNRRLQGEPLAYIIGEWDFYGLTLTINPEVLIPRQDTEIIVERALAMLDGVPSPRILDLCCGSGAIGIAILANKEDASCVFADNAKGALRICRTNLESYGLTARSTVLEADVMEPSPPGLGVFDLIVCNPPYISGEEMLVLPWGVSNYEPADALYGGSDGLSFYRAIAAGYQDCIKPGGSLLFECGAYQGFEVEEILKANNYVKIARHLDLNKIERAVSARRI